MGSFAVGDIVTVLFPFSNLSSGKVRPAVVLADANRGDWVLCQMTSKPYADKSAISIRVSDFAKGSLPVDSYARPNKLFIAHESIFRNVAASLKPKKRQEILRLVRLLFAE